MDETRRHAIVQWIGICDTYCSHGGVCGLTPNHEGLHDSGYCTFTDSEAITRAEADAMAQGDPWREWALTMVRTIEAMSDEIAPE